MALQQLVGRRLRQAAVVANQRLVHIGSRCPACKAAASQNRRPSISSTVARRCCSLGRTAQGVQAQRLGGFGQFVQVVVQQVHKAGNSLRVRSGVQAMSRSMCSFCTAASRSALIFS